MGVEGANCPWVYVESGLARVIQDLVEDLKITDPTESHTSTGIPESLLNSTPVPSSLIAISNFGSSSKFTIIYTQAGK